LSIVDAPAHQLCNASSGTQQIEEDQDISNASAMLNRAINMMKALRRPFDEVHEGAVNVAGIWCVNTTFTEKWIGRAPRMCT